jgi:hypothetical protein
MVLSEGIPIPSIPARTPGEEEDEACAIEQEHTGRTASLMHEWHGTRRRHVGKRLPHEGLT